MGHRLVLSPAEALLMQDRSLKADALSAQSVDLQRRAEGTIRAAVLAIAAAHSIDNPEAYEAAFERAADGSFVGVELREPAK